MTIAQELGVILQFAGAILDCASVVILFVTAIFVWRQVREIRHATNATAFKSVYDILQADDVREARRVVLTSLADKAYESWTDQEIKLADKVGATYDSVGIMVKHGMIPVEVVADNWGDSLRRNWRILSPLVMRYRAQRNSRDYWNEFEWLARQADKYRQTVYSQE
jgi:hypothetical protein